ncbi:MAG TPA: phosphate ABC transporter substrate-binding protein PstS [Solirubrobacteraceae bacterium]|nr:phosphate ABC transporter substrate-binding protein PstS [Solirubrobacteraceae bacterium]
MFTSRISAIVVTAAAVLGIAACGSSSGTTSTKSSTKSSTSISPATINGAGSTLAAPIYMQWGSNLKSQGLTVNYSAVGSGTGVADLEAGTVDFAGSDPPLAAADIAIAKKKGTPVHFPMAFGAITVSYNLPGVNTGLKLTGKVIGDIFDGSVKKWNDPEIAALNSGMSLPATTITVVHRSDSSGTTAGFTTFVSDYSPTFKKKIGAGKLVPWPSGEVGAAKNAGVAAAIKQTSGAIGYVEQAYALQNGFHYAAVQNKAGKFVLPTIQNTSAAAVGLKVPSDLRFVAINSPNPAAYPIVSQTFIIVYQDLCKAGVSASAAKGVHDFLNYALTTGESELGPSSNQLPYAPLPPTLIADDKAKLATLACNGAPVG